jgi:ABC-2 type transport system permease protein
MVVSSLILKLDVGRIFYFACAIALMSGSLCGLAVGLGAIFPNLKEDNPSKIVSGFGGTLCLVSSFVYIVVFIGLLAFPASLPFTWPALSSSAANSIRWVATGLALLLSMGALTVPLSVAAQRLRQAQW